MIPTVFAIRCSAVSNLLSGTDKATCEGTKQTIGGGPAELQRGSYQEQSLYEPQKNVENVKDKMETFGRKLETTRKKPTVNCRTERHNELKLRETDGVRVNVGLLNAVWASTSRAPPGDLPAAPPGTWPTWCFCLSVSGTWSFLLSQVSCQGGLSMEGT